ncbi:MAG TPA: SHOCT domain-containing protein [Candidatus Dormibacteraeota bacterium]|nr:SHOCT domain-containing protein [Candidatus Dormibacteraeota bacterium]
MMWGYSDAWSWLWMGAMMLIFWGGIGLVIVLGLRAFATQRGGETPLDVLRRRLASGEITQDEFDRTRRALQS